jgi:hypothetical protein
MRIILLIAFTLSSFSSLGQTKKPVYLSDLIEQAIFSEEEEITIDADVVSIANMPKVPDGYGGEEYMSLDAYLLQKYPDLPKDTSGYILIDKKVNLSINEAEFFKLKKLHFSDFSLSIIRSYNFTIEECHFDKLKIKINESNDIFFRENYIGHSDLDFVTIDNKKNGTFYYTDSKAISSKLQLDGFLNVFLISNIFILQPSESLDESDSLFSLVNNEMIDYVDYKHNFTFFFKSIDQVIIDGNKSSEPIGAYQFAKISLSGEIKDLTIEDNELYQAISLAYLTVSEKLVIVGNEFKGYKGIGFYKFTFPEQFIDIDWNQLKNKIYITTYFYNKEAGMGRYDVIPYFGTSVHEMQFYNYYRSLLAVYSKFYNHYKSVGDIDAANAVFIELKDLHTLRYQYLAEKDGDMASIFKWRLNQLLAKFNGYGTDPITSVIISFYIIIGFTIFYFFFPSEWDREPKYKTWLQMKLAFKKNNDTPFWSTITKSSIYFTIGMVNAFTLSINSFVTLGFGTIPTRGLPRYVCILQGFLGWFLLSLFLVALLNQVSF